MDWIEYIHTATRFLKKYRYAFLVIAAGILLLTYPGCEEQSDTVPASVSAPEEPISLERSLVQILSLIDGAGKVEVLLTPARGAETVYQMNENSSSGERGTDRRTDTVLITEQQRSETGLIKQINPPVYQGAVIVCQGAGNPQVRLSVVQAVMSVTDLTSDRITVLKMK